MHLLIQSGFEMVKMWFLAARGLTTVYLRRMQSLYLLVKTVSTSVYIHFRSCPRLAAHVPPVEVLPRDHVTLGLLNGVYLGTLIGT